MSEAVPAPVSDYWAVDSRVKDPMKSVCRSCGKTGPTSHDKICSGCWFEAKRDVITRAAKNAGVPIL